MKKINFMVAVLAVILMTVGCQKAATKTSSDAAAYYPLGAMTVDMIESALDKLSGDVKRVELTITDLYPDLSEIRQIIKSRIDILFKLDLSKCTAMTSIGEGALIKCASLASVTIGKEVTSIEDCAFIKCTSLASVTIGKGVMSIGESAFELCSSLTSVTIPDSVMSIRNEAFSGCESLASVTIGKGVMSIGDGAFGLCRGLTTLSVKATTPPTFGEYILDGCSSLEKIYVPTSSVDAYKSALVWEEYSGKIQGTKF